MGKETLHALVDRINDNDISTIYQVLVRFAPEPEEVPPLPDEVEAIENAKSEIDRGDVVWYPRKTAI